MQHPCSERLIADVISRFGCKIISTGEEKERERDRGKEFAEDVAIIKYPDLSIFGADVGVRGVRNGAVTFAASDVIKHNCTADKFSLSRQVILDSNRLS